MAAIIPTIRITLKQGQNGSGDVEWDVEGRAESAGKSRQRVGSASLLHGNE